MIKCPICKTIAKDENQEYCLVCGWEFEYFFNELSSEEKDRYNKKIAIHRKLYQKSIEPRVEIKEVKKSNRYLVSVIVGLTLLSSGLGWKLLEKDNFGLEKIITTITEKNYFIKPQMVKIDRGSFIMGSDSGDSDEKPPHRVTIDYDFEIGKYEVTIGEYKACVADGGCKQPEWLEKGNSYNIHTGSADFYKKMCLKDNCPIIGISWNDAKAYAKWLSRKTSKNYRLPTEAEWEFVARAGTTTKWSFGNSESSLKKYAWYNGNSNGRTHDVGIKQPNPWGVYDMHGNVWEWCEDWYLDSYNNTPKDGSANHSQKDNYKVLRGGSWVNFATFTRSASRYWYDPSFRYDHVGFRLQRTLP